MNPFQFAFGRGYYIQFIQLSESQIPHITHNNLCFPWPWKVIMCQSYLVRCPGHTIHSGYVLQQSSIAEYLRDDHVAWVPPIAPHLRGVGIFIQILL